MEEVLPNHPANQYLQVIYGDGYSLILQMTINLDLKIIKTNKYNYDSCGFFAFTSREKILGYRDPRCKHENSSIITSVLRIEMMLDSQSYK